LNFEPIEAPMSCASVSSRGMLAQMFLSLFGVLVIRRRR
jgi:hypothetical protein